MSLPDSRYSIKTEFTGQFDLDKCIDRIPGKQYVLRYCDDFIYATNDKDFLIFYAKLHKKNGEKIIVIKD